jgi:cell division protein ZapA
VSDDSVAVEVYILDKTYRIACSAEEREALLASARVLNDKMRDVRGSGKVLSVDRVAIMAGLNIAHDYLRLKNSGVSGAPPEHIERRIVALSNKVAAALNRDE